MKLSKAYNLKNLIDEDWLIRELEKDWKVESANDHYWSSFVRFHNNSVLVRLFFGYGEGYGENQRPRYYSSLSIVDSTTKVSKFLAIPFYCWGDRYPSSRDVIQFYRDTMRKLLFPYGPRNQEQLCPNEQKKGRVNYIETRMRL